MKVRARTACRLLFDCACSSDPHRQTSCNRGALSISLPPIRLERRAGINCELHRHPVARNDLFIPSISGRYLNFLARYGLPRERPKRPLLDVALPTMRRARDQP